MIQSLKAVLNQLLLKKKRQKSRKRSPLFCPVNAVDNGSVFFVQIITTFINICFKWWFYSA